MDKAQIMVLLSPFINGQVPEDKRWDRKLSKISRKIPDSEVDSAITILEEMFHNPFNPDSNPENAIPGAHGIYQRLIARKLHLGTRERR